SGHPTSGQTLASTDSDFACFVVDATLTPLPERHWFRLATPAARPDGWFHPVQVHGQPASAPLLP
ncbi:MAG TPA: hypothetical protein VF598_04365, partial [Hymenobacter sp.]